MSKYWERETPVTIITTKNIIRNYPQAKQLCISRLPWTDSNGVEKPGKGVTLNLLALYESDATTMEAARAIFAEIVDKIDLRLSVQ